MSRGIWKQIVVWLMVLSISISSSGLQAFASDTVAGGSNEPQAIAGDVTYGNPDSGSKTDDSQVGKEDSGSDQTNGDIGSSDSGSENGGTGSETGENSNGESATENGGNNSGTEEDGDSNKENGIGNGGNSNNESGTGDGGNSNDESGSEGSDSENKGTEEDAENSEIDEDSGQKDGETEEIENEEVSLEDEENLDEEVLDEDKESEEIEEEKIELTVSGGNMLAEAAEEAVKISKNDKTSLRTGLQEASSSYTLSEDEKTMTYVLTKNIELGNQIHLENLGYENVIFLADKDITIKRSSSFTGSNLISVGTGKNLTIGSKEGMQGSITIDGGAVITENIETTYEGKVATYTNSGLTATKGLIYMYTDSALTIYSKVKLCNNVSWRTWPSSSKDRKDYYGNACVIGNGGGKLTLEGCEITGNGHLAKEAGDRCMPLISNYQYAGSNAELIINDVNIMITIP